MRKQEFLIALRRKLKGLTKREIDERICFYSEMIDDRIEEGYTEEEAVAKIGSTDDISEQIISELHVSNPKKKRKSGKIALFWIGSPLWISLAAAAVSIVIALYAALWSVVVSLWAAFVAFVVAAIGGTVASVPFAINGNVATGFAMLGASLVCGGLAIFTFYGGKATTRSAWWLTKKVAGIKKCFAKREEQI